MAVLFPGGIIASDAMPWLSTRTGKEVDPNTWPIPDDAYSHPRSAGTFIRFLSQYVRDRKLISWSDAIAKTSYLPAKYLEEIAPQMRKKGRIQVGIDADITVFDPAKVNRIEIEILVAIRSQANRISFTEANGIYHAIPVACDVASNNCVTSLGGIIWNPESIF
jgi:N-acyl-D-aspartate/D-glutamate deacylase